MIGRVTLPKSEWDFIENKTKQNKINSLLRMFLKQADHTVSFPLKYLNTFWTLVCGFNLQS